MFIQQLWLLEFHWDEKLLKDIVERREKFSQDLVWLKALSIPRCTFNFHQNQDYHGFCNDQEWVQEQVYTKTQVDVYKWQSSLLCAKTKVTPNNQYSIPRLELCFMLLLAQLVAKLRSSLDINSEIFTLWSDSTTALTWITIYQEGGKCLFKIESPESKKLLSNSVIFGQGRIRQISPHVEYQLIILQTPNYEEMVPHFQKSHHQNGLHLSSSIQIHQNSNQ